MRSLRGGRTAAGGWPWKSGLVILAALVALPTVGLLVTVRLSRHASEQRARQENVQEASTIASQLVASYQQRVLLVSTVPAESAVVAALATGASSRLAQALSAVAAKDGFCLLAVSAPGLTRIDGSHGGPCWDPPPVSEATPGIEIVTETVRQSGDALLNIINDILDFSKIEAGELELERQPFSLRDSVESAMALVAVVASAKGLELVAELNDSCPAMIVGDPTRFRQVVVNMLSNAVKFTAEGEVHLTVACQQPAPGTDGPLRLTLAVRDTGIGIPADRMHRLFQSFSQVDSSTTRTYGGTGLGLVISRRLAEAMGGDLSVSSEIGVGSVFTFTASLQGMADRRAAGPSPSLAGKSVLLVDDNATNLRVLGGLLRHWGLTCTEVDTPLGALELVTTGAHFDGAVLDRYMPGMDGIQLAGALRTQSTGAPLPMLLLASSNERVPRTTARIRSEAPRDHQPRIVAVTANVLTEDRTACLGAGMDDFLAKPIRTTELVAVLALTPPRRVIPVSTG